MKFVISSSQLLTHLTSISKVISSKSTLPILDCFLFNLSGNDLKITASDLEITLITNINLENAEESGDVAIPAKILLNTLKEFKDQLLLFEINTESFSVVIKSDTGVFNLVGESADVFPMPVDVKEESAHSLSLNADVLFSGINKTMFATTTDELRPVLGGIFIDATDSDITFVGTDAHKLVRYIRTDTKADKPCSFILPKKAASLLKNILIKVDIPVSIVFDERNARIMLDEYQIICRLVEGNYPNYNSVIPQQSPIRATVNKDTLLKAIKRVSIYSSQISNLVSFQFTNNNLVVSAKDMDFSISAHDSMSCEYESDDMDMGFKATFIIEMLSNLTSDYVVFKLTDPLKAGLIIPLEVSNANEDILMLLMPMMIS